MLLHQEIDKNVDRSKGTLYGGSGFQKSHNAFYLSDSDDSENE